MHIYCRLGLRLPLKQTTDSPWNRMLIKSSDGRISSMNIKLIAKNEAIKLIRLNEINKAHSFMWIFLHFKAIILC